MHWQYRTILFEFQKDGLLGDKYVDDEEVEKILNEQGEQGWELVSVTAVQEGLLTFFKRMRQQKPAAQLSSRGEQPAELRGEAARQPSFVSPPRGREGQQIPKQSPAEVQPSLGPPKKGGAVGEIKIS